MSNNRDTYSLARTLEDKDVYKAVLDTRNFEISLFWQRSNYFLALNSALAIGFFTREPSRVTLLLASLGALSSVLWYFVMLGSKYWQSRWEDKLAEIERVIAPDLKAFAASRDETDAAARRALSSTKHRRWADAVMRKPSVSYHMTLLSGTFIIGWCVVAGLSIFDGALSRAGTSAGAIPTQPAVDQRQAASCSVSPAPAASGVSTNSATSNPVINIQVGVPEPRRPSPPANPTPVKPQCP
jgi:hypothetical protein